MLALFVQGRVQQGSRGGAVIVEAQNTNTYVVRHVRDNWCSCVAVRLMRFSNHVRDKLFIFDGFLRFGVVQDTPGTICDQFSNRS